MNKHKAEAEICRLVKKVDAIRDGDLSTEDKTIAIADFDAQIMDLKKITGPRKIVGQMNMGDPSLDKPLPPVV